MRRFTLLLLVFCIAPFSTVFGSDTALRQTAIGWLGGYQPFSLFAESGGSLDNFEGSADGIEINIVDMPTDGGIKEDVPNAYKAKFEKWKAEFRSTEIGRLQWDSYANNKNFVLTIKVVRSRGKGAGTDKFLWDDAGKFVGATITLGSELDNGYPSPIYYPVLNSLSQDEMTYPINGTILAATKLSHELGHVDQTAKVNAEFVQLQDRLMVAYNSIFLKNGLKTTDKRLVDLAQQMGGTPVEIWESREYWSEVNAMLFLKERISKEYFYCSVFNKIRRNLKDYAADFEQRFVLFPEYSNSSCWK